MRNVQIGKTYKGRQFYGVLIHCKIESVHHVRADSPKDAIKMAKDNIKSELNDYGITALQIQPKEVHGEFGYKEKLNV